MKIPKLRLSFDRYSDESLELRASSILEMLTGNPFFPSPVPPLTELSAAIDSYEQALVAAQTRDKVKVAAKRTARIALEGVLYQLALFVMYVANGSEEMLTSSGFELVRQPETATLEQPGAVTLVNGITSGQLRASLQKPKGAYGFVFEISADAATQPATWTSRTQQSTKTVFEGLTPGQRYWVRIAAVGSKGQIAYTPTASQIVI